MRPDVQKLAWLLDPSFLSLLACMTLIAISAGFVVYYRSLQREEQEPPLTDDDLLAEFQAARDAGELDETEFQRVCQVIKERSLHQASGEVTAPPLTVKSPPPAEGEGAPTAETQSGELPDAPGT
jgi:hypothetical protein